MEDTLRVRVIEQIILRLQVLILVLMEDTLRGMLSAARLFRVRVLILVLMEDTLRVKQNLRILEFRGFDNSKTYKIGFC